MGTACKVGVIAAIGSLLIIGSGLLIYFFPSIVESQVSESLNLEAQKGLPFDNWAALSLPLSMKFYFFDVQNPIDVVYNGAKPKLVEKGPYTFSETREKINITWNETEHTVTYRQIRNYKFEKSQSVGDIDDDITLPNVAAIAIAVMGRNESEMNQKTLSIAMTGSGGVKKESVSLYRAKSVREWLFDGYFDSFIQKAQGIAKKEILPNHTFGFFYGFNGTDDGTYTVYTGKNDVSKYSVIKEWKGPEHLFPKVDEWERYDKIPLWNTSTHCSDINGTDGQQFPPFIKKESRLRIFISEMCRSAYVVFQKEVEHQGITAYRFVPDLNMMADPSLNPDNECFCEDPKECMFTGAISLRKCQRDAPVFASFPHFYQADPLLLKTVDGLKPDPDKHAILLDVEPMTGTPINARRCSQVNVEMEPAYPMYKDTEHIKMPRMYHPVLWFSEEGTLDGRIADEFKKMAVTPVQIGTGVIYSVLGFGIILFVIAVVVYCRRKKDSLDEMRLGPVYSGKKVENINEASPTTVSSNGNAIDQKDKKF
uniref:Scavenger receptor class B member 1 n=1 Tax=Strigamia maritima TaxID=126957 RepID=T1JA91_STRMM